ncbi:DNA replication complex GINS protein PSF3-like [Hevea brasiliensis]|uniref:DNA replication complex GINS protein PSF3-like n=1 Tax=Hevea brasiliensis TaxID=3981 RepID=UPI0025DB9CA8|nr:DNA replication complex GINS protein PSF3-like [Hevea brasiliensis]
MANYYDIDDILTEEEFVPVVFHKVVNGVKIDESTERGFVEQGSKAELPFWLARELHLRQAVSMSAPACFNEKTRLEIQADAACVDLRSRCPYFYEFGCKLAPLCDKTIGLLLSYAFRIRYKEVLYKAHTTAFAAASKFLALLTKEETNLYQAAQSSLTDFKRWRMGGPRLQRASILGRKRKPT